MIEINSYRRKAVYQRRRRRHNKIIIIRKLPDAIDSQCHEKFSFQQFGGVAFDVTSLVCVR